MASKSVIDTHAPIWYLENNPKLGASAKVVLDDPTSDMTLPIIALAEAIDMVNKGRTGISSTADLLRDVRHDPRIKIYPLTFAVLNLTLNLTAI